MPVFENLSTNIPKCLKFISYDPRHTPFTHHLQGSLILFQ